MNFELILIYPTSILLSIFQIFEDSYDTKEAMNESLGTSLINRVNEATKGAITDEKYTTKNNDYVNDGTRFSNNADVSHGGVEYRMLANKEKDF